ncbi:MAG: hypothetical protein J6V44_11735 [Methanobrevibacter sp.]|nr:hypothetical protein [Methanobrevibacter sp.]
MLVTDGVIVKFQLPYVISEGPSSVSPFCVATAVFVAVLLFLLTVAVIVAVLFTESS